MPGHEAVLDLDLTHHWGGILTFPGGTRGIFVLLTYVNLPTEDGRRTYKAHMPHNPHELYKPCNPNKPHKPNKPARVWDLGLGVQHHFFFFFFWGGGGS